MQIVIVKMITGEVFKKTFPDYNEALEFKKKLYTSLYASWQCDFTKNLTIFQKAISFIEIKKENDLLWEI